MNCKKCGIGYGHDRCHGMVSYGEVLVCDQCNKKWETYYHNYKMIRFPDGIPFYWLNWSESKERDELFKEWCNPTKIGCYWCKWRKGWKCSGHSLEHKIYNHNICCDKDAKNEKDLIRIVKLKHKENYGMYGKPYGYLCEFYKSGGFQFR